MIAEDSTGAAAALKGRRILLVEDEYLIDYMQRGLEAAGSDVIGPAPSVEDALALIAQESVDGAVLDFNLGGEKSYPVADALQARGIPFLFATGYDAGDILPAWQHVRRLEKPIDVATIARVLSVQAAP